MARKKWTPKEEITASLLKLREKRKWQLAYRRYVLEGLPSESYAPYFGLDSKTLRDWFSAQFTDGLSWESFGQNWQFEHIIPANYFDFTNETDLKLCWNYLNIRVEKLDPENPGADRVDPMATRIYFEELYSKTGFTVITDFIEKIREIEKTNTKAVPAIEQFIISRKEELATIHTLSPEEIRSLNQRIPLSDILLEREILRKFSSGQKP